ncbi:iron-sulfur protein [Clostridia bacterium]|nr:iron-sulfur protein [Clostridia bacterium]
MSNIIFYFTGTGNSLKVARDIGAALPNCTLISMVTPYHMTEKVDSIGFVYPVYFRGVPLAVKKFVESMDLSAASNAYLFATATCGGSPGSGLKELNALLSAKGRTLDYGTLINMGGNYILMYGKPDKADTANAQADRALIGIAGEIRNKSKRPCGKSNPVSTLFAEIFRKSVHKAALKYTVSDDCTSCGLCAKICPVNNIEIKGGKPVFGDHCEQCMACIQWCPGKAINYKGKTENRKRYHHPDINAQDLMRK